MRQTNEESHVVLLRHSAAPIYFFLPSTAAASPLPIPLRDTPALDPSKGCTWRYSGSRGPCIPALEVRGYKFSGGQRKTHGKSKRYPPARKERRREMFKTRTKLKTQKNHQEKTQMNYVCFCYVVGSQSGSLLYCSSLLAQGKGLVSSVAHRYNWFEPKIE